MALSSETEPSSLGSETILERLLEIARASVLAEMASGIAHELNQPLGAIAAFAQAGERMLGREDPMITRALDVFRQINQEALGAGEGIKRIRRLFEQDLSQRTRCQMPKLIEELRPVLEILTNRPRGALHVDSTEEESPHLLIDRLRIQHVLYALAQNAVEAGETFSGKPTIHIDVSANRYMVETGISDSGPGVPTDSQYRLFRPFFTTKPRGTGLGLASSRAIVEAHGGSIGFENLPKGGSRFWFRLPFAET